MPKDYLQPLLNLMQENAKRQDERMDTLEAKLDRTTEVANQTLDQARYTNGRVTKAEEAIRRLERKGFKRVNVSPHTVYLIALAFVIVLIIIAASLHIKLGGLFG